MSSVRLVSTRRNGYVLRHIQLVKRIWLDGGVGAVDEKVLVGILVVERSGVFGRIQGHEGVYKPVLTVILTRASNQRYVVPYLEGG